MSTTCFTLLAVLLTAASQQDTASQQQDTANTSDSTKKEEAFKFEEFDSRVTFLVRPTTAHSKVTAWAVNMTTSSAMLGIDSYIPPSENGFWIIGFKSRIHDLQSMFPTQLGQMTQLAGEEGEGFCSNLPYFYNYLIDDILSLDTLYQETAEGDHISIFDWRIRYNYPVIAAEDGQQYDKTSLKASRASLKQMTKCMNVSQQYQNNTFVYEKVLFHTYVRVKDSCVNEYVFDVERCTDIYETTTLLLWRINSAVKVTSSVESIDVGPIVGGAPVSATISNTRLFQYTSEEGFNMTTSDASMQIAFPSTSENDHYFYIPGSFQVIKDSDYTSWELLSSPEVDLTKILQYLSHQHSLPPNTTLNTGLFSSVLSEHSFPLSLLPGDMNQEEEFRFSIVNEADKRQDTVQVTTNYGLITCDMEEGTEEGTCRFGAVVSEVSSQFDITFEAQAEVYAYELNLEWTVVLISASAANGDNINPLRGEFRPLYSLESLVVDFSISPTFVLQQHDLELVYLWLSQPSTDSSYVLYSHPGEEEDPFAEDARHLSFGSFNCASVGVCKLVLASQVFASHSAGLYELEIMLQLKQHSRQKRTSSTYQHGSEDSTPDTQTLKLEFVYGGDALAGDDVLIVSTSSSTSLLSNCFLLLRLVVYYYAYDYISTFAVEGLYFLFGSYFSSILLDWWTVISSCWVVCLVVGWYLTLDSCYESLFAQQNAE